MADSKKNITELKAQITELKYLLEEANDTIEAIRTGQVDALIVQKESGHELYTLQTADLAYRIFIENMTEGAVTLSGDGTILYCNSSFADIIGTSLSEIVGVPMHNFVAPEERDHYDAFFQACRESDCKEEVILQGDTKKITAQLSFAAIKTESEDLYSVIVTDLSVQKNIQAELKKNNEALEASNRDLQRFASVASHDLQEPVRKVQVFAGLLAKEAEQLSGDGKKYLGKIVTSAVRMKALIIDMLNYSRLSSEEDAFAVTDLNEVLAEVKEDLELSIAETGTVIKAEKLPTLSANRGQMRQVFQNIISNAIKFSKSGKVPQVKITAKRIKERSFDSPSKKDGAFYLIGIKDKGIGFDEKYAANIFELFERLNAKDAYEGTGIGLAIAKKIIEKHKGLISAMGKENEGAEFLIILPAPNNA